MKHHRGIRNSRVASTEQKNQCVRGMQLPSSLSIGHNKAFANVGIHVDFLIFCSVAFLYACLGK